MDVDIFPNLLSLTSAVQLLSHRVAEKLISCNVESMLGVSERNSSLNLIIGIVAIMSECHGDC